MRQQRNYYSLRRGLNENAGPLSLTTFKRLFLATYHELERAGFFQEHFGIDCVDGYIDGAFGSDLNAVVLRHLRKEDMLPVEAHLDSYTEADLFDMIEFLHDHSSQGEQGSYHQFASCGYHYETFDRAAGQSEFRRRLNDLLQEYGPGYELSVDGEILELPAAGMEPLGAAGLPALDTSNVTERVERAKALFRRQRSSLDDRKNALRELADVLEFVRPAAKRVLNSADERDLFEIANRFGIRHHRLDQKSDYDADIYYSWLYYYYLATIHACTRLIERAERRERSEEASGGDE